MDQDRNIKCLDPEVVLKIAAGEVVQRPVSAVKELLENSVDAGAQTIKIHVREGGLKRILVIDDGCGIQKNDLDLVCKRFATSKLKKFDDLQSIATHGFRGEALASMSQVARVSIISKTKDLPYGHKAVYENGVLKSPPLPLGMPNGTQVTIDDLFYNDRNRLKMFAGTHSAEYQKIVRVVTRYAVHYSGIGITLKRLDDGDVAVKTAPGTDIKDNIKALFGLSIASHIREVEFKSDLHKYKMKGYMTDPGYSSNKMTFMFFVNNRLVEHEGIKKEIEDMYNKFLTDGGPFVYLRLDIDPSFVDVNVHPSKNLVCFLYEDVIIKALRIHAEKELLQCKDTRSYVVQQVLSPVVKKVADADSKIYDHKKVRTDSKEQKLEKFFGPTETNLNTSDKEISKTKLPEKCDGFSSVKEKDSDTSDNNAPLQNGDALSVQQNKITKASGKTVKRRIFRLTSLLQLCKTVRDSVNEEYKTVLNQATFVGCINERYALIQHELSLMLCDTYLLTRELLYQKILQEFGNMACWDLSENPLPLLDVLKLGLNNENTHAGEIQEQKAIELKNLLNVKAPLLYDYYSIKIDDGFILRLPRVLGELKPNIGYIPKFFVQLATAVVWTEEKSCLHTIARELADFYASDFYLATGNQFHPFRDDSKSAQLKWTIQHVLYRNMREDFYPPEELCSKNVINNLTCLTGLYSIFERC
ncbi:DNA mismatch repair protein Mlh1 isoform X1 [Schistocerca cancellata]|uniref:DNA mismatch repair protein Mlh1 isoform X1 n=1 Tax=Schistocerca cancellata TaxID=274614 RepID=UPI0021186EAC|nr:DNA mismatch repair protein Mlh1 isoform X1 [Schistocerca cancellata]